MGRESAITRALRAIDDGHVSVEETLRAAVQGATRFEAWLDRRLEETATLPPARPHLRRRKTYPRAAANAALAKARRLFRNNPDVVSIHWGLRRRRTRPTSEDAVLVFVDRKQPLRLIPQPDRLPRFLEVRVRQKTYRVTVDVQGVGAEGGVLRSVENARPGARAAVTVAGTRGTLGGLVELPLGFHALLSGHVAGSKGQPVAGQAITGQAIDLGTVQKLVLGLSGDSALAGPIPNPDQARALLVKPEVALRDPSKNDLHLAVFIQTIREVKKVFVDGVDATGTFRGAGGQAITISGLTTVTPDYVDPGDSGAPVLDHIGRVIGFVVGSRDGRTYLMPARRAAHAPA